MQKPNARRHFSAADPDFDWRNPLYAYDLTGNTRVNDRKRWATERENRKATRRSKGGK